MTEREWTPRPAEPFERGNMRHLVHGASSPRVIEERAREVHTRLLEVAPWLAEDVFLPAVSRYLRAESRAQLLHEHILRLSSSEKGPASVPQRLWEGATASDRLAASLGDELGLSPRGRAEVARAVASATLAGESVADLARRGAEIRQRRAAAEAEREGVVEVSEAVEGGEVSS